MVGLDTGRAAGPAIAVLAAALTLLLAADAAEASCGSGNRVNPHRRGVAGSRPRLARLARLAKQGESSWVSMSKT